MDFFIKVEKESEYKIIIETPAELGKQTLNLLLEEGYTLREFSPKRMGRSANNAFVLENPEMKYYSLLVLAQ